MAKDIYIYFFFAYTMVTARDEAFARAAGVNSGRPRLNEATQSSEARQQAVHARGRSGLDRQVGGGQRHGQPSALQWRGGLGVRHAQVGCGLASAARAARGGLGVEAPPFL